MAAYDQDKGTTGASAPSNSQQGSQPTSVTGAIKRLDETLAENVKLLSALADRLKPILMAHPHEDFVTGKASDEAVPLLNQLDAMHEKANSVRSGLDMLLSKLAL